ncbi:MAG TPA: amidohydrolase family protein [Vicinamibacterales bacterium]|nr:amidohydrolase family protein [Vicinamibacterales bacterium]
MPTALSCEPLSRRSFLTATTSAAAFAAASCARTQDDGGQSTTSSTPQGLVGDGQKRRILLRGGVVLSLDPKVGDFEKADVLIDGKKIAQVAPTIAADGAEVVDCSGTIVMPGFITTHHHQYETLQRSIIADGLLQGAWPQETYGSVVQNIWTAGRIADPGDPSKIIWDLGRVPYDPEDCYIAQVVACLSEISQGITTGTDTSQANHTPEHTDAMIKGLMDSGRRTVFAYSGGTNRSADGIPFEFPGAMNDTTKGIGRIAKTYFSSKDQLVTLGFAGGAVAAFEGAPYTGWQLGRSFGASMHNHVVGNPMGIVNAAADARNGTDWSDVTFIHATRWQDTPQAQISYGASGYPGSNKSKAWELVRDRGAHVSIANLIEMQMRHGMPPFQEALNHGILPSLSPDVDTNMTTDPFSLMRGAFCLQRALANDLAFPESNPGGLPIPQLVTSRQVIEMATIAGAASNRILDKVGTLTPGKEADIVVLEARGINTWPMNNVPGTIVTMMNPSHVRDVLIAGKVVYWKRQLVGWDVEKLLGQVEQSRDRVLALINGPAKVGTLPKGLNSFSNPYRPNFLGDCCFKGQNTTAPEYVLRP